MIGIIVAMEKEAEHVIPCVKNATELTLSGKHIIKGKLFSKEVVIAICGIGKVNASLTTQLIIDNFNPNLIFNFGSCGGVNDNVKLLNYYVIDGACQYDFDLSALDPVPVGYIQDYNRVMFPTLSKFTGFETTTLASSDRFTHTPDDIKTVNNTGASACDMEGGAIAQVCLANDMPCIMLKGISDVYGHNVQDFKANLNTLVKGFPEIIEKLLNNI